MKQASFRFYEELNDFLPSGKRKVSFAYDFTGRPSVKDAIEALGVPHVEVDLVIVNGESVDFDYHIENGDRISVYPVFETLDISPVTRLRPEPLRETKFILDAHLGRLAKYLRMCGFDTLFDNNYSDPEIIDIAVKEKRIILTRDREMLKNNRITHACWIRSETYYDQLREVLLHFDLCGQLCLCERCSVCNTMLKDVVKEEVEERLEPGTKRNFDRFKICPGCNRIYWEGSHYKRMKDLINHICEKC